MTTHSVLGQVDRSGAEGLNNVGTNFKPMPKPGYTCITISKTLYRQLKEEARRRKVSIPRLIEQLLSTSTHGVENKPNSHLFQRKSWARRDSNPRPTGYEPARLLVRVDSDFEKYVSGLCRRYRRDILNHLRKLSILTPADVKQLIHGRDGKNYALALRKYLRFLEEVKGVDVSFWFRLVKVPRSGVDSRVPLLSEILETADKLREPWKNVYLLLAMSGVRATELLQMLHSFDQGRVMDYGDVAVYPLSRLKQSKRCLYVFLPGSVVRRLKPMRIRLWGFRTAVYRSRGVTPKYLRKWFYNQALEVMDSVLVDFIQGRSLGIGGLHYLDKLRKAVQGYQRLLPTLQPLEVRLLEA